MPQAEEQIIEIFQDQIPVLSYEEIVKQENIFRYPTFIGANLIGGKAVLGSGNKVMKFEQDKGLWLGNADFNNAPFKVDMNGNVTLSGYIAVGGAAQDIINNNTQIGAANLNTTVISGGKIVSGLLTASNIQTGTLNASLVNVINLNADNITAGTLTGRTVQTKSTGARVVMETTGDYANQLLFYSLDGLEIGIHDDTIISYKRDAGITFNATDRVSIFFPVPSADKRYLHITRGSAGGHVRLYPDLGSIEFACTLLPTSAYNLGSSSYKWQHLYLSGNIYMDAGKTVDGIDISSHAADASAHHSSTSSGITIYPAGCHPYSTNAYNLGSTSYYWNNLYLNYLRFNSSYGRIYWGTDLLLDIYAAEVICRKHWKPPRSTGYNLGGSDKKWEWVYRANEGGCDLPTSNSAIKVFKKIKPPEVYDGDYGKRHYFNEEDFPEEMKAINDKEEKSIEFTRTLGVAVQAIRELIQKVEKLEEKIK